MIPSFYEPLELGPRPWGQERLVSLVPGVASLKVLVLKAGKKGRLQRHHRKDEAGYVLAGSLIIRYADGEELKERTLTSGESFYFPVGSIHQEEAIIDTTILEVSTPFADDREGCEEMFGLDVPDDALPSTEPEDVKTIEAWW